VALTTKRPWRENEKIDFSFYDAHDLYLARDTSQPESIKRRLTERMKNAKQFVLLGSAAAKKKGGDGKSFLAHEVENMVALDLPVVIANIDGSRTVDRSVIPKPLLDAAYYTVSVSYQPAIIKFALDKYAPKFAGSAETGPHYYKSEIYKSIGL
jgi:hypothetical protein